LGLKHVGVYCNIIDILINYMCISWYYNIFIKYARYDYKNDYDMFTGNLSPTYQRNLLSPSSRSSKNNKFAAETIVLYT
jgi:hypothetical protein